MIESEHVPDEAMNALLMALRLRKSGKEVIAAALNAWPGMSIESLNPFGETKHVVLPLEDK